MKKFHILILLTVAAFFAGCGSANIESARKAYSLYQFSHSAEMYRKVYSKSKEREIKKEAAFMAAESYRRNNEFKKAESYYRLATRIKYDDPIAYYYYALMQKNQEKYEDALVSFKEYKEKAPTDTMADFQIKSVENAIKWKEQEEDSRYRVESFKPANTPYNDYAPMYYKKNALVFTSDRDGTTGKKTYGWTGVGYTDLFMMEEGRGRRKGRWESPEKLEGPILSPWNEGVATFNDRGTEMYFTQCNGFNGKDSTCRIYHARKKGKEWADPVVLPFNADTTLKHKYGHPYLSDDGERLFFSSDRPGGFGGHDLWVSFYVKRGKTWSDPVNLGPKVNTASDEMYPFVWKDTVLFFASDGHMGMGGLDIFRSYGEGSNWGDPTNLKAPINSGGDDFAYIQDENATSGYFSSNRPRARGDDIYRFDIEPLIFTLSGVVYNSKTNEIIPNAMVTLTNDRDNTVDTMRTDETGSYKFTLAEEVSYEVRAEKKYYISSKEEFATTKGLRKSTDLYQNLYLTPFFVEQEFLLEGIYYDLDKAFIRPDAAKVLDSLIQVLQAHPYLKIELGSHTDCRNTMEYNENLSQRRADSAVAYLVRNGIDSARLVAKGYGETVLVNDCECEGGVVKRRCTEEEHQANRRTTFSILSLDYEPAKKSPEEQEKQSPNSPQNKSNPPNRPGNPR